MTGLHSVSAIHDRLAITPEELSTGPQSISNPAPFITSFTPTVDGTYEVGVRAGSFASGGGGALRMIVRMSSGAGSAAYPADVFNSDSFPPFLISTPTDHVYGTVNLLAGVTYGVTIGGGGGTTGGQIDTFIRLV